MRKSIYCAALLLGMSLGSWADAFGDAVAKVAAQQSGRLQFVTASPDGAWKTESTLVFQRPDKVHYWSKTTSAKGPGADHHVWLDASKLWVWTSRAGAEESAPKNAYYTVEHKGGIATGPLDQAFGPANFALILLAGDREMLDLEKKEGVDVWTADGDQLVIDPVSHLLKQVVAWNGDKKMASADVSWSDEPVKPEELTFTLPEGAKELKRQ